MDVDDWSIGRFEKYPKTDKQEGVFTMRELICQKINAKEQELNEKINSQGKEKAP